MFNTHIDVTTKFQCRVYKADGTLARESAKFNNIVLNQGLDLMSSQQWSNYCAVGTGNSTPTATQTGLDALQAYTNTEGTTRGTTQFYDDPVAPYFVETKSYAFAAGTFNNINLQEISIGRITNEVFVAWNRALIRDVNGDPTTLTILADEILEVIAEVHYYPDITKRTTVIDVFDKLNLVGQYTITTQPRQLADVNAMYAFSIIEPCTYRSEGLLLSTSGWSEDMYTSIDYSRTFYRLDGYGYTYTKVIDPYVAGSYTRTHHITLPINHANGSLGLIQICSTLGWQQYKIEPPLVKTNVQTLTLSFTYSWGRYEG